MTAEWGHRYLAFTDYDAQIVEVELFKIELNEIIIVMQAHSVLGKIGEFTKMASLLT